MSAKTSVWSGLRSRGARTRSACRGAVNLAISILGSVGNSCYEMKCDLIHCFVQVRDGRGVGKGAAGRAGEVPSLGSSFRGRVSRSRVRL